jgi:restriction endonuclease Mrr
MNQFDTVFEKCLYSLNEKEYIDSTFVDNVRLLVKTLIDSDLLPKEKSLDVVVNQVMTQPKNVKEIVLDTKEQSLPSLKLQVKQSSSDSEDFSVTVIDVQDPTKQKEFTNSMLETVFEDVLQYIKTLSLQGLSPEAAVDTLPPSEGANAQPGAEGGESALPGVDGNKGPTSQQPTV